jgi:hypothetical protein
LGHDLIAIIVSDDASFAAFFERFAPLAFPSVAGSKAALGFKTDSDVAFHRRACARWCK